MKRGLTWSLLDTIFFLATRTKIQFSYPTSSGINVVCLSTVLIKIVKFARIETVNLTLAYWQAEQKSIDQTLLFTKQIFKILQK